MNAFPTFDAALSAANSEIARSSLIASVSVLFVSVSGLTMQLTVARGGMIVAVEPVE